MSVKSKLHFFSKDLPKCYLVDIAKENKNSNTLFEIQVQKVAR